MSCPHPSSLSWLSSSRASCAAIRRCLLRQSLAPLGFVRTGVVCQWMAVATRIALAFWIVMLADATLVAQHAEAIMSQEERGVSQFPMASVAPEVDSVVLAQPMGFFRQPFESWFSPWQLGYGQQATQRWLDSQTQLTVWGNARASYSHDQRIAFSGQESTFLAEGAVLASVVHQTEQSFQLSATGELFLNERFDDNVLTDYALRESFRHNFEVDALEFSQMFISAGRNNWHIDVGRFVTPFGRSWDRPVNNARTMAPFIRTESIGARETGLQGRWNPGIFRFATAVTNGSYGRDTNSSKALVARYGIEMENVTSGLSVKWQDGVGSEGQKEFQNHVGVDLRVRRGRFSVAGEWIYDQYGLRRPGTPLDQIDWGRSIYNRQLNAGLNQPITGQGWYVNAIWMGERWTSIVGYGQFHPEQIGDAVHDQVTRRARAKVLVHLNRRLDFFASALLENDVDNAQDRRRKGTFISSGLQFNF